MIGHFLMKLYLDVFSPWVMATPRNWPGIGEDTIWSYTRMSSEGIPRGWQLSGPKHRVHSGKKNGGPWYSFGTWHNTWIPETSPSVTISTLLLNSASEPSIHELNQLLDRLEAEQTVEFELTTAGPNPALAPLLDHLKKAGTFAVGTIGNLHPVVKGLISGAIGFLSDLVGGFLINQDAIVFYDSVVIVNPQAMEKDKGQPFQKRMKVSERAEYELKYILLSFCWEVFSFSVPRDLKSNNPR